MVNKITNGIKFRSDPVFVVRVGSTYTCLIHTKFYYILMRSGLANLPLHGGKAPRWLFSRMVVLSREITRHVVDEYGPEEMLIRLSDPFWFQAFGCVLGFDWHSSGVTTTTCGAVKEGIKGMEKELGFFSAGGKGAVSRKTPEEITKFGEKYSVDPAPLVKASRLSAKVDNSVLQDGYQLYHHSFFFTDNGEWCVVQQGFNDSRNYARRYHWLGSSVESFVNEPQTAICCNRTGTTFNLSASESDGTRNAVTEIASHPYRHLKTEIKHLPTLSLPGRHMITEADINPKYLEKIMLKTYENAPEDFESLLGIQGVGAKTLRALALVAELIYGTKTSVKDPARFSFAHGGKDGTPFPVDRKTYDTTIHILGNALDRAKVDISDRAKAYQRLKNFAKLRTGNK